MAAFPAILCRCGIAFFTTPLLQAICAALCRRPFSTTAAFPAILCRCGTAFSAHPLYRPSARHCPSAPFPQRQRFLRFSAVAAPPFLRTLSTGLLRGIVLPLLFHNGSKTCDSLPLWNSFFRRTLAAGHLFRIVPLPLFHNGSISCDSLPLRHGFFRHTLSTGSLRGIVPPSLFHNGSISCDSLPLR